MARFKFQVEAGFLIRKEVRISLERSKDTLEYLYPGSSVKIREEKDWVESTFCVQGTNFPDTDEFENRIKKWTNNIKYAY